VKDFKVDGIERIIHEDLSIVQCSGIFTASPATTTSATSTTKPNHHHNHHHTHQHHTHVHTTREPAEKETVAFQYDHYTVRTDPVTSVSITV
jgi:hypothetical protein